MSWLMVVLLAAAVARVTVLVRTDRITRPLRYGVANKVAPGGYLRYLLGCPWCISIWVGAAAAITAYFWWHTAAYRIIVLTLALSYIASMLAQGPWEDDSDLPLDEPLPPAEGGEG